MVCLPGVKTDCVGLGEEYQHQTQQNIMIGHHTSLHMKLLQLIIKLTLCIVLNLLQINITFWIGMCTELGQLIYIIH